MKKILSILCCAVMLMSVSSCTKQYVTKNNNQTILLDLTSNKWASTDGGKTWSTTIKAPQIDDYVNDHDGILVYFSFTDQVYEQVPEVYQGIAYSYTHNTGFLTLYAQAADGVSIIPAPDDTGVKIVLVDSN